MKTIVKQHIQPIALPTRKHLLRKDHAESPLCMKAELKWMKHVLQVIFYLTMLSGIMSFGLSVHNAAAVTLIGSGLLSVLSSIVVLFARLQIEKSKNWMEICILALCSIYAPFFALWIVCGNLLAAFGIA